MPAAKNIVEKLNLSKYTTKLILQKPDELNDFHDINYDSSIQNESYDLVFIFVFNLSELLEQLKMVIEKNLVNENGYLFFAYPKKNNPQYKEYIERDSLMESIPANKDGYVLNSGLKFSRLVSLNDTFTVVGLKAASKKATRTSSKNSQRVEDYIGHIEDIKQYLSKHEDLLKFYDELTPGYQKDWARYVYSAKRKETQEKRLLEMETVLGQGYKTMDLYKRNNK